MFTINSQWNTTKEQDRLAESLFGTVHIISKDKVEERYGQEKYGHIEKSKKKTKAEEKKLKTKLKTKEVRYADITLNHENENKHYKKDISGMADGTSRDKLEMCFGKEIENMKKKKRVKLGQKVEEKSGKEINKEVSSKHKEGFKQLKMKDSDKTLNTENKIKITQEEGYSKKIIDGERKTMMKVKKKKKKNPSQCNNTKNVLIGLDEFKSDSVTNDKGESMLKIKMKKRRKKMVDFDDSTVGENVNEERDSTLHEDEKQVEDEETMEDSPPPPKKMKTECLSKYTNFQKKIKARLKGGQFRWINEKLYSSKSSDAANLFRSDPQLFDVYHTGFHAQVQQWPENPVQVIIDLVNLRDPSLVIADFGCGDAKLAKSVANKVYSFDLVALNDHVTACDMKNVPIPDSSVDIAIFCLSLMGINLVDFILEARRVLKVGGTLHIAEVKSRFDDIDKFNQDLCKLGFNLLTLNEKNKMFLMLEFEKNKDVFAKKGKELRLNPCIYKRR